MRISLVHARTSLISLETRRLRGDLTEVSRIFKGFISVDYLKFFRLSTTGLGLRGRSHKLFNHSFG